METEQGESLLFLNYPKLQILDLKFDFASFSMLNC